MNSKSTFALLVSLIGTFGAVYAAHAEAPVVDLSRAQSQDPMISSSLEVDQNDAASSARTNATHQNESMDQRVLRLERQISNLTEMNFVSKVEKIQQEVQQLHGQIEVQNHELTQVKEQVRSFYQDLDQRLAKVQTEQTPTVDKHESAETIKAQTKETVALSATANKTKELQSYESAFNLLNKKEYDKAISSFQTFVNEYPNSSYTVNAHYWLGEILYLKGKSDEANAQFQLIVTNYPDNPKVADALLKIALIAMDNGNYAKAKLNLTKVQKQFPGSTAAKIASLRLKEIKQKQ